VEQAENQTGKGRRKILLAAVAVIAVAAAGVVGGKTVYEGKVQEFVDRSGGKADLVKVDFLGRIHLRNLTLPLGDGTTVRIAAVDGRQKLAFLPGELMVNGVDVDMPTGTIAVGHARFEDVDINDALLREASDIDGAAALPKQVASFAAKRVTIPELTTTQTFANTSQKTTYKNVVLSDVANGRIAHYGAEGSNFDFTFEVPDDDGATKEQRIVVSTGAIEFKDFDAAYLARIYTEKAGPDDKDAKPLYGPFSVKTIAFSDSGSNFSYDEMRGEGVSVRMPSEPLMETLKTFSAAPNVDDLSVEDRKAYFAKFVSIIDMFDKMDMQILGMKVDAPDKAAEGSDKRINMSVERTEMQVGNRELSMGLHGFSMKNGDDTVDVAEASITGFNWSSTLDGLTALAGLDEQQVDSFPFNTLMPELGTIRFAGIDFDIANPKKNEETGEDETADAGPERIQFTLKNYEMSLTKPYNGIPTDIDVKQEDLTLPIPEDSSDETFAQMRQLGLKALTFSYGLSAGWDEANKNLVIRDISINAKDIGSANISGLVSGFTKEFFSLDTGRAQAALFGLAGREVKFTVKDEGLIAKAVELYALQNGMTEDQVRGTLTMVASMGLQQVASERPKLKDATDAILRFLATHGTLSFTVRATGPNGLGVFDLVAASQDPLLLLDKVEIEATAN
jgi:hypothetical protein